MTACWLAGIPFVAIDRRWPAGRVDALLNLLGVDVIVKEKTVDTKARTVAARDGAESYTLGGGGRVPVVALDLASVVMREEGGAGGAGPTSTVFDVDAAEAGARSDDAGVAAVVVGETEPSLARTACRCGVAYYATTSGTTGVPKVVETSQTALYEAAWAKAEAEGLGERGGGGGPPAPARVLLASHFTFDPCQVDTAAALMTGSILLAPPRAAVTGPAFSVVLSALAATHMCCTPTQFRMLPPPASTTPAATAFPSLRCVTLGGEPFPYAALQKDGWFGYAARAGGDGGKGGDGDGHARPSIIFRNTYGLTEGTGYQSTCVVAWSGVDAASSPSCSPNGLSNGGGAPPCIGRGFGSYRLLVEDGEVVIEGPGLSRYYDPERLCSAGASARPASIAGATAPLRTPRLRTGDLGEDTPAGIVLRGRRDGRVKIRGQRVGLEDIDSAITGHISWARDAVACVVPPTARDAAAAAAVAHEPATSLGLCVTVDPALCDVPLDVLAAAVSAVAQHHLQAAAVPAQIAVQFGVGGTSITTTSTGKLDRAAVLPVVREQHAARLARLVYTAPATPLEHLVAEAWTACGVAPAAVAGGATANDDEGGGAVRVGATHDFNLLGGDSIAALRVVNYIRARAGVARRALHANADGVGAPKGTRSGSGVDGGVVDGLETVAGSTAPPITAFDGVASMLVTAEAPEASVCELSEVMGPFAPCELIARPVLRDYARYLEGAGVRVRGGAHAASGAAPPAGARVTARMDPPPHAVGSNATHRAVVHCIRHGVHDVFDTLLAVDALRPARGVAGSSAHDSAATPAAWGPLHEAVAHGNRHALQTLVRWVAEQEEEEEGLHHSRGGPRSGVAWAGVAHVAAARGDAWALREVLRALRGRRGGRGGAADAAKAGAAGAAGEPAAGVDSSNTCVPSFITARDEDQQTLLHLAARSGVPDAVAAVCDTWAACLPAATHDALKHAADADGRSALRWAIENGHTAVVDLLLERGCRPAAGFEAMMVGRGVGGSVNSAVPLPLPATTGNAVDAKQETPAGGGSGEAMAKHAEESTGVDAGERGEDAAGADGADDESFGRVKRRNRGVPHAVAHRKVQHDDAQLQRLHAIITDATAADGDRAEALSVLRNLCCAVKAHRLWVVRRGLLDDLKGFVEDVLRDRRGFKGDANRNSSSDAASAPQHPADDDDDGWTPSGTATHALGLLRNLAHEAATKRAMVDRGFVPLLTAVVREVPAAHEATWRAVSCLGNMSTVPHSWPALLAAGVLHDLEGMSATGALGLGFPKPLVERFRAAAPAALPSASLVRPGEPRGDAASAGVCEADAAPGGRLDANEEEEASPAAHGLFD